MPKPYSDDLRARVVKSVLGGRSCRAVAKIYGVSDSFVVKLVQRWRTHKSFKAELKERLAAAAKAWPETTVKPA